MQTHRVFLIIAALLLTMESLGMTITTHKSSELPINCKDLKEQDLPKLIPVLENIKVRMDDWPQLAFYQKATDQIAPPLPHEDRVVFMGDSITEFWSNPQYGAFFPGKPYINRGIKAQTTPQMLLRLRADVINLAPKVMVLLAGANDIGSNTGPMTLSQTQDNIMSMVELAAAHSIKVILCSVLPTSNYHFDGKDPRGPQTVKRPLEKIRALNGWLKSYCEQKGYLYVDYFSSMVDSKGMLRFDLSEDDVHPNARGYAIMVPLVEAAISQALKHQSR